MIELLWCSDGLGLGGMMELPLEIGNSLKLSLCKMPSRAVLGQAHRPGHEFTRG
jgi:hypothetical protein